MMPAPTIVCHQKKIPHQKAKRNFVICGFVCVTQWQGVKSMLAAAESLWLIANIAFWVWQTGHLFEGISLTKAYLAMFVG